MVPSIPNSRRVAGLVELNGERSDQVGTVRTHREIDGIEDARHPSINALALSSTQEEPPSVARSFSDLLLERNHMDYYNISNL